MREGEFPQTADVSFKFELSDQDQERLRWYFEDYLQYPQEPAPSIAQQAESQMAEIGLDLFAKIFRGNDQASDIWAEAKRNLNDTRIEIVTQVQEATAIPWELICDPGTAQPLAMVASSFMRTYTQAAIPPRPPQTGSGPIRILLAICRPSGDEDVPFRSVASRVISGLSKGDGSRFQLDLLRPPTFDQLGKVLRKAKEDGKPYHVFHFDGHGTYEDLSGSPGLSGPNRNIFAGQRTGACGYLLFENPLKKEKMELIDGTRLGNLLRETNVPITVLNACRSAYAESPNVPAAAEEAAQMDSHARVRAFGSLAQEVMHSGTSGVVAMRYVVYVVTAAQFVAELYDALVRGRTLEEAVSLGRKNLYDQQVREIAFRERTLQDWSVPVVFGAGSLALFPREKGDKKLEVKIGEAEIIPERGYLDENLPPSPDTGFFGRDETLQTIDRAFDSHKIVLLHAYAGHGKTAAAAEFARWYSLTGGVDGPVLFTSFERHKPLPRVLDKIGQVFGEILEHQEQPIHWSTLDNAQRRSAAIKVLKQVPVLWIWDNVEPVAGFPKGTESAWSSQEQQELVDFLRAARETKAKFLLTSRRDEKEWLGDLPRSISVPPMPMFERVELARAIADKRGHRLVDIDSLKPLLRYTEGNPLTLTVLVGQVLREGLIEKDKIERFVDQLRSGEKEIEDDENQGRSKSLGASLRYGSENAFDDSERRILALLSLFQGFVYVDTFRVMGTGPFSLKELHGLDLEQGRKLFDRAAEVGMLTALGNGYYRIHPALPWFFRSLFQHYYKGREEEADRAFVEAERRLSNYYLGQFDAGHPEVISVLAYEEANLLYARQLALEKGWPSAAIWSMQGLKKLYDQTGRWIEWGRLVEEVVPYFVDAKTGGPLPGQERDWSTVTGYQVNLKIKSRQWDDALKLQKKKVEWDHEIAGPALTMDLNKIDEMNWVNIRNYLVSLGQLARIQVEIGDKECIRNYKEAIEAGEKYGLREISASYSMNLGIAYKTLAQIRNLGEADYWCRRSLDLTPESSFMDRGRCFVNLGNVASERFKDTLQSGEPEVKYLQDSLDFYHKGLEAFPADAKDELAATHNALGVIYDYSSMFDEAIKQYQKAIYLIDEVGDTYRAGATRLNVAKSLAKANRLSDALEYARSALEKFKACGSAGADGWRRAQNLITRLEEDLRSKVDQAS
ncbi:MAG: CHAT domain protein [Methanosaeta sp. PtaU1.Bin028]|nr:MAG: CHAT domain protein [Methanosaeta sp. PtaU1.Bin028]